MMIRVWMRAALSGLVTIFSTCEQRDSRPISGPLAPRLEVIPVRRVDTGGRAHPKVGPISEVSRAEEAGPKLSVRKARLGERLGDGRLSCPGWAIQPENVPVLFTRHQRHETSC